jgi:hypothetical protein
MVLVANSGTVNGATTGSRISDSGSWIVMLEVTVKSKSSQQG